MQRRGHTVSPLPNLQKSPKIEAHIKHIPDLHGCFMLGIGVRNLKSIHIDGPNGLRDELTEKCRREATDDGLLIESLEIMRPQRA
jgi:hypothetical protein